MIVKTFRDFLPSFPHFLDKDDGKAQIGKKVICTKSTMDSSDFRVTHSGSQYNVNDFLRNHPGGLNYMEPFKEKEVADKMKRTQHSEAAYYLLREYKISGRDTRTGVDNQEDLEKLVDWNRPMLSQVGKLGPMYKKWVISPVDRKLRLFGNPLLEYMTITPWYVVPLVWIPIITYFVLLGTRKYVAITNDESLLVPGSSFVGGAFLWTLLEYSLHRWVFHMEPSGKSPAMIFIHFAIHGLHHKVPFDTRRLVFPPLPAAAIAYTIYRFFYLFLPQSILILIVAGALFGYVVYDMIHFYLHHGSPNEGTYFYFLKRYHNQHHFAHHDSGFGISSGFWDRVFGTAITLRNLAMGIKWS